jgi:hypothetical protein
VALDPLRAPLEPLAPDPVFPPLEPVALDPVPPLLAPAAEPVPPAEPADWANADAASNADAAKTTAFNFISDTSRKRWCPETRGVAGWAVLRKQDWCTVSVRPPLGGCTVV